MAARKRKGVDSLPEVWKEKIRAAQIINRLQKAFNGEVELTQVQTKIADILLKKVVPDLARQELTGKDGEKLSLTVVTGLPSHDDPQAD